MAGNMYHACMFGDVDVVQTAISAGWAVNESLVGSIKSMIPILIATEAGHTDVVAALLEAGADPDVGDDNNTTPLHLATLRAFPSIVNALLGAGANPNAISQVYGTPLQLAVQLHFQAAVVAIIKAGGCITAVDAFGNSLLHLVCQDGHCKQANASLLVGFRLLHAPNAKRTYSALIDAGASIEVWNENGCSPLDCADPEDRSFIIERAKGRLENGIVSRGRSGL